jgi:hypothetical protein
VIESNEATLNLKHTFFTFIIFIQSTSLWWPLSHLHVANLSLLKRIERVEILKVDE